MHDPSSTLDLCGDTLRQARTIDSLIPMVQRAAGPVALLRDERLEILVSPGGAIAARFVGNRTRGATLLDAPGEAVEVRGLVERAH